MHICTNRAPAPEVREWARPRTRARPADHAARPRPPRTPRTRSPHRGTPRTRPRPGVLRAAVDLAPDALARTLGVPAPAVRKAVDQLQAAAVGLVALGMPGHRGAGAGVGHLQADGTDGLTEDARQGQPQHGRTAGVHHGVGDEFGDEQDQRLGERLISPYPGPGQPRTGPSPSSPHLRGVGPDLQLHLKHLHRSHHPNRRTHRLAPHEGHDRGHDLHDQNQDHGT